jgi:hypothetical protein
MRNGDDGRKRAERKKRVFSGENMGIPEGEMMRVVVGVMRSWRLFSRGN